MQKENDPSCHHLHSTSKVSRGLGPPPGTLLPVQAQDCYHSPGRRMTPAVFRRTRDRATQKGEGCGRHRWSTGDQEEQMQVRQRMWQEGQFRHPAQQSRSPLVPPWKAWGICCTLMKTPKQSPMGLEKVSWEGQAGLSDRDDKEKRQMAPGDILHTRGTWCSVFLFC